MVEANTFLNKRLHIFYFILLKLDPSRFINLLFIIINLLLAVLKSGLMYQTLQQCPASGHVVKKDLIMFAYDRAMK